MIEKDTIKLTTVKFDRKRDTLIDSLRISSKTANILHLKESFKLSYNIPIYKIVDSLINIRNIDSLLISFKTRINKDEEELDIIFEASPSDEYNINLYPNAIVDIRGNVNDTLNYKVITQTLEDYGNIYLDVVRNNDSKFILHLIDNNGDIVREYINVSQNSTYSFDLIRPGKYSFRLIEDLNENSKWDTGNYLKKIKPEPVYYYKDEIEVRANWDLNETFNLDSILIRKNDSILRN